ncbi:MAG: pyrroline-5-carboxylate reductase [Oscillospiraceae bacterium]|nr:pyrroline-5-carboxylate reductase [Oscillospiraceae bacterium]
MMAKFGFIGAGNMGSALAAAAAESVGGENILISNRTPEKALSLAERLGAKASTNADIAFCADYIILGVKPQMMESVITGIAPVLRERKTSFTLVSMAAGLTIDKLRTIFGADYPFIRVMPNTPCSVGEGVMLWTSDGVDDASLGAFLDAFRCAGDLVELPERLFDAGSALSGCGPAYCFMFIEALADGAVACGIPRKTAYELACATIKGSAALMQASGKHPGELKDAVCSPGGSTIEAVRTLEEGAFRASVMDAVIAARDKNRELG